MLIKEPVLNIVDIISNNKTTTCFSNLGPISFDAKIDKYISSVSALTSTNAFQFTICSFKDDLCIGVSNRFVRNDVIKDFLRFFTNNNIEVNIDVSEVSE